MRTGCYDTDHFHQEYRLSESHNPGLRSLRRCVASPVLAGLGRCVDSSVQMSSWKVVCLSDTLQRNQVATQLLE